MPKLGDDVLYPKSSKVKVIVAAPCDQTETCQSSSAV